jgi:hypothetical protein
MFVEKSIGGKLRQLWNILQEIYTNDPNSVVDCVTNLVDKKLPKGLTEYEKKQLRDRSLAKFIRTSKKVNTVTDFIFDQIKADNQAQSLDVLSICGILISFVVNSQSHLYFVMENIKKAAGILNTNYDIEEIFSRTSKAVQNTESVSDIQAIRNAVCHGSFNIEYNKIRNEYSIDF